MSTGRRRPDCRVTMDEHELNTGQGQFRLKADERSDGLLGSLGANRSIDVSARRCPVRGLVRLYAEERPVAH